MDFWYYPRWSLDVTELRQANYDTVFKAVCYGLMLSKDVPGECWCSLREGNNRWWSLIFFGRVSFAFFCLGGRKRASAFVCV